MLLNADKGGALVIMNTLDYITEAHRQLLNSNHYTKLDIDPTTAYRKELKNIIKTLPATQSYLIELVPGNPKTGTFYMLPKIHKEGIGVPEGTMLATICVESLYTNIPHKDGIDTGKAFLEKHDQPSQAVQLIEFSLTRNCFFFGQEVFLQRMGTSMGTHFAPQYANLFMAKLEEDFLSTCNTKPLTYLNIHPTINDSFHPDHTKHSIIYSQALLYNRKCSDTTERNHHLKTLKADFINRGYNPMNVDQYIHAATKIPRSHLLQHKQKPEINRVPLVDERFKSIFPDPPLLAFRQPPNLKSLITRSALLYPTKNGTYHCGKKQCKTCPLILTSDKLPIPDK
ncbi:hypothetical protein XELAEV_18026936mg [Xenopus laevis]|uniref:Helix-turn-helix domain-containing protein n=1 Tax=Xenopus laevis TaxID=8355 RepID=A0A974CWM8_XENLA|nr:hypothetical protein XELAEV_18026936mg [Xenopus laevis]